MIGLILSLIVVFVIAAWMRRMSRNTARAAWSEPRKIATEIAEAKQAEYQRGQNGFVLLLFGAIIALGMIVAHFH